MSILFYGDPHGVWQPLFEAVEKHRPVAVVLLGDMDLDEPLRVKLKPVWDLAPQWKYILGNHDTDERMSYEHLVGDYPEGNLQGNITMLDGRLIAGLGGVFKAKVWAPRYEGDANEAKYDSAADMIRRTARADRWKAMGDEIPGLPLSHRDTIFPADVARLKNKKCDILVTHEAPASHPYGFEGLDVLARDMRARLVVHGHQHVDYNGGSKYGTAVRGVADSTAWLLDDVILDGVSDQV